jgi:hypothetical protein|eukprot:SAG25_NODE_651_length_6170_cov_759.229451_2_plen_120_part_00
MVFPPTTWEVGYELDVQVGQNGWLLSRRGRISPAISSGFDTHRDAITRDVQDAMGGWYTSAVTQLGEGRVKIHYKVRWASPSWNRCMSAAIIHRCHACSYHGVDDGCSAPRLYEGLSIS